MSSYSYKLTFYIFKEIIMIKFTQFYNCIENSPINMIHYIFYLYYKFYNIMITYEHVLRKTLNIVL